MQLTNHDAIIELMQKVQQTQMLSVQNVCENL